jgi:outer membrane protein assembly factor BamB
MKRSTAWHALATAFFLTACPPLDAVAAEPADGPVEASAEKTPVDASRNTDLPRFLPNNGNCVLPASGLLRSWPAGGPKELWRTKVGHGKAAVVEVAGRAFTAGELDGKQMAICLDPAIGAIRWKHSLLDRPNRHFEWGPCTSPVVDGDRVYYIAYAVGNDVWDMRCPIVCLKTNGTPLWRADKTFFGTEASTPLVVGDTLYVGADSPQRDVLVALDKYTGKLRWSVRADPPKKDELGAPASLTYQVVDGVPQVIVGTYGTRELLGVHAETGQLMWRYPYPARIIIGLIATPVAIDRRLYVCGGEGRGQEFSALLEMKGDAGKISFREVYVSTDLQTNKYHTPSIYQGAVFGFGGGAKAGFLHATNLDDGLLLWKRAAPEWTNEQNLMIADGLIFALTKDDQLVLAEASRDAYKELGRFHLGKDIKLGRPQHPTLANGRLYIRGSESVACFQVAK